MPPEPIPPLTGESGTSGSTVSTDRTATKDGVVTKDQKKTIMFLLTQRIRQSMFTIHAAPRKDERDVRILAHTSEVAMEVFGSSPLPFKVRDRCVKMMWEVRAAFRAFAEHSVEYLFNLNLNPRPSPDCSQDQCDYTRNTVQDLLSQRDYSFFHKEVGLPVVMCLILLSFVSNLF